MAEHGLAEITGALDRSSLDHRVMAAVSQLPPEVLLECFRNLEDHADLRAVILTCRSWAVCAIAQLWARPHLADLRMLQGLQQTLAVERIGSFHYRDFIRRLNLSTVHKDVGDDDLAGFMTCSKLERLVVGGCKNVSDAALSGLVDRNRGLVSLDLSGLGQLGHVTFMTVAARCSSLQGLNLSECSAIDNDDLLAIAKGCPELRRIKLNKCSKIGDRAVLALAEPRQLLELDLEGCSDVSSASLKQVLRLCPIRDLKLNLCGAIGDECFAELIRDELPALRSIDLTGCSRITDTSIYHIVNAASKLRSLSLTRCINLTDRGIVQISRLGKYLHHLHLGHCSNLTDRSVIFLVKYCSRLRYIDLACCYNLTDAAVVALSGLARVKRIGLVKCNSVTNHGILTLANAPAIQVSLERIHLSYCTQLTLESVSRLLDVCPLLTHISLTGVLDFLRNDLIRFCRPPPADFNQPQAAVL